MRSTAQRRRVRLYATVLAGALAVACQDGSGGLRKGVARAPTGSSVTLGWADASGPVAGYAVFVQRDGGDFLREQNVPIPSVTLEGDPGETVVVGVAAFDGNGNLGPGSGASAPFTFPHPLDAAAAAASAPPPEATASATASSLPASGSGGTSATPGEGGATADPAGSASDAAATEAEAEAEGEALAATDLAGALLWGSEDALRVTDSALGTLLLATAPPAGELLGSDDFDGDGAADLLWSDGALLAYTPLAHGAPTLDFGRLEPGEWVAAAGDFDGDGAADLVLRDATGALGVWLTGSGAPAEALGLQGEARLAGVADFDGDGADDLLWREADGALSLWLMDAVSAHTTLELVADRALEVLGAGDFDGDGAAELALRDGDGALFHHEPLEGRTFPAGHAPAARWRAVGAADVDGDGRDDLVLVAADALRGVSLPEGAAWEQALDPASPWELLALLP